VSYPDAYDRVVIDLLATQKRGAPAPPKWEPAGW